MSAKEQEDNLLSKEECLDHIARVWTDMRPLSVRIQMDERRDSGPPDRQRRSRDPFDSYKITQG